MYTSSLNPRKLKAEGYLEQNFTVSAAVSWCLGCIHRGPCFLFGLCSTMTTFCGAGDDPVFWRLEEPIKPLPARRRFGYPLGIFVVLVFHVVDLYIPPQVTDLLSWWKEIAIPSTPANCRILVKKTSDQDTGWQTDGVERKTLTTCLPS